MSTLDDIATAQTVIDCDRSLFRYFTRDEAEQNSTLLAHFADSFSHPNTSALDSPKPSDLLLDPELVGIALIDPLILDTPYFVGVTDNGEMDLGAAAYSHLMLSEIEISLDPECPFIGSPHISAQGGAIALAWLQSGDAKLQRVQEHVKAHDRPYTRISEHGSILGTYHAFSHMIEWLSPTAWFMLEDEFPTFSESQNLSPLGIDPKCYKQALKCQQGDHSRPSNPLT